MASLTLRTSWLNRLDTGEGIGAYTAAGAARSYSTDGEVTTWAGGRQRATATVGEKGQMPVRMLVVTSSTVDKLRTWVGIPVAFRDTFGLRFVGTFFAVQPTPRRGEPGLYDAEFTLQVVTTVDGQ